MVTYTPQNFTTCIRNIELRNFKNYALISSFRGIFGFPHNGRVMIMNLFGHQRDVIGQLVSRGFLVVPTFLALWTSLSIYFHYIGK